VSKGTWSVALSGTITLTGGPQFYGQIPGTDFKASGYVGISGSISGTAAGSIAIEDNKCTNKRSGKGTVDFVFTGALTGGGDLTANIGRLRWTVANATITGSLTRGYHGEVSCDTGGCTLDGFTPKDGWKGKVSGKVCAFGTCGEKTFYEGK
jgi:hypothetical protein